MVTIIGIPFGWEHWKLARLALWPFGAIIRHKSELPMVRQGAVHGVPQQAVVMQQQYVVPNQQTVIVTSGQPQYGTHVVQYH